MATAAKATVSLHLDTTGIVEQLRGLADAIEASGTASAPTVKPVGELIGFIALDCDGQIASIEPTKMVEVGADVFSANLEPARPGQPFRVVEVREVSA